MNRLAFVLAFCGWLPLAWAVPAIVYDPADATVPGRVTQLGEVPSTAAAPVNSLVVDSPWEGMPALEQTAMVTLKTTYDDLRVRNIPTRYWKVLSGVLSEMSQAEKTTLDAPAVAEATRQQTFTNQISSDSACSGELATIDSQIDAAYASASTVAQVKTVTIAILKRVARCVRARAR